MNFTAKIFLLTSILLSVSTDAHATPSFESLVDPNGVITATLSPDAKKVAKIVSTNDSVVIKIASLSNQNEHTVFDTQNYSSGNSFIDSVDWIDNQHIAINLVQSKKGVHELLPNEKIENLYIASIDKANQQLYKVRTRGQLFSSLPNEERYFLYAKNGISSKVYKINVAELSSVDKKLGKLDKIDGGQFVNSNTIVGVNGRAIRWFSKDGNNPHAVLFFNRNKEIKLSSVNEDGVHSDIHTWDTKEVTKLRKEKEFNENKIDMFHLLPISMGPTDKSFYAFDTEENINKSIYLVDFEDKSFKRIYQTPSYEILSIVKDQDFNLVGVKTRQEAKIHFEYFDRDSSDEKNVQQGRWITEANKDINSAIVYAESFNYPGAFYFFDKSSNKEKLIGYRNIDVKSPLLGHQHTGTVSVDDLKIHFILNTPSKGKNSYPLIVMPHGGPIDIFDDPYFDTVTQYFVLNGFAVLRVNFRGSSGYSEDFVEAGKMQWSTGMIRDILEATKTVANRKDIDESKVCAVGFSYGGYASLMLGLKHAAKKNVSTENQIFKCVASIAGITDLILYANTSHASTEQLSWIKEQIGDPNKDLERLKNQSPTYLSHELNVPLFVGHGLKDIRVDVEHAYRLNAMLNKHNIAHEFYIDEESGHNFSDTEKSKILFEKILSFLKANI